jgi:phosphoribosylformylglycinamidine cyclo-ligase
LARRVFFETLALGPRDRVPGSDSKEAIGRRLLAPHLSYLKPVSEVLEHPGLHALAHITGGGLTDNLPRLLPKKTHALVRVGSWEIPEIFHLIQEHGEVASEEMFRVFNMGIGMCLVIDPAAAREIMATLKQAGQPASPIGTVQKGGRGVVYDLSVPVCVPGHNT